MRLPIYLDHNATTPVDERVLERMLPYFSKEFGNPASQGHAYGWTAEEAVGVAREQVAGLIGAAPEDIVFTAGATEAINTALKGIAAAYARKGRHVVTVQTEHSAVLETCRALERQGLSVTYLPVDPSGRLRLADLEAALTDETIVVAVMWANNETGTIQPIPEIAEIVRARGILFMTDATQGMGKIPVDVAHADVLACSAHKFYGPKGVGALYVRRRDPRVRLVPLLDGGGQERGMRGGTLNVPGIVGMGAAAEIAGAERAAEAERLAALRDGLEARLRESALDVRIHAADAPRLPQTSSVAFPGVRAANLLMALRDLALSAGSACSSGTGRPSHVLRALGLSDETALSTLRFSLGRSTTAEEIDRAASLVESAVASLRGEDVTA